MVAIGKECVAGGTLSTETAAASADGKYLYVAFACEIRVYRAATATQIRQLKGHAARVTAIAVDCENSYQIFTASADQTIKQWDTQKGVCLSTKQLSTLVKNIVSCGPDTLVAFIGRADREKGRVGRLTVSTGEWRVMDTLETAGTRLSGGSSCRMAAAHERNTLYIFQLQPQIVAIKPHLTKRITCVALDPSGHYVATGDVSGRINLWSGLHAAFEAVKVGEQMTRVVDRMKQQTVHWHSQSVLSICFSEDGKYLLSGGHEAVLVIWQIQTMDRDFVTRLGGSISHITRVPGDPAKYCIGQTSNAMRIINIATKLVESTVYGVRPAAYGQSGAEACRGITMQPKSGHLVLPCTGSQLQLYDAVRDRHVARIQVSRRNTTAESNAMGTGTLNADYKEPAVELACFTHDESVLVTLERLPAVGACMGDGWQIMKFWDVLTGEDGQTAYSVNGVVSNSHFGRVTGIAAHPHDMFVATSCVHSVSTGSRSRGSVRLWQQCHFKRKPGAPKHETTWFWKCYKILNHQGTAMHSCAFSHDGSIIAAGGESCVSLWAQEGNLLGALVCPFSNKAENSNSTEDSAKVPHVAFLKSSPCLVSSHKSPSFNGFCVWNVASLTLQWASQGLVEDLCAHPRMPLFTILFVTKPFKPVQIMEIDAVKKTEVRRWQQCGPKTQRIFYSVQGERYKNASLILISDERLMLRIPQGESVAPVLRDVGNLDEDLQDSKKPDKLVELLQLSAAEQSKNVEKLPWDIQLDPLKSVLPLQSESHLLPDASALCDRILYALLSTSDSHQKS